MFLKQVTLVNIVCGFLFFLSFSTTQTGIKMENISTVPHAEIRTTGTDKDLFLEQLFRRYPQYFDSILKNRKEWNVQVIYTRVDREMDGSPVLTNHYFNVDSNRYFYPASTVKLPLVLLALQRLNELKEKGIDKNSTMITGTAESWQTPVYNDPTTPDGKPTIAQYIRKILMVSDNDAYNRIYEFLGQEYINDQLHKKGYTDAQILHHLEIVLSEQQNRQTNPVKFLGPNNALLYDQAARDNTVTYAQRNDHIGKAYLKGNQLINESMNFSKKNRISLQDLHTILIGVVFPDKVKPTQLFNITDEDKQFVLKYMSQLPTESISPPYGDDTTNYWPAYSKMILFGAEKGKLPENIRIFNKEGDAYGHLIDVTYVVDLKNKVEFFLSAVIYCNSDGVLNDDKYDYDNIGLPFMKHLGQVIYDLELKRERKRVPDLSPFVFKYDK